MYNKTAKTLDDELPRFGPFSAVYDKFSPDTTPFIPADNESYVARGIPTIFILVALAAVRCHLEIEPSRTTLEYFN